MSITKTIQKIALGAALLAAPLVSSCSDYDMVNSDTDHPSDSYQGDDDDTNYGDDDTYQGDDDTIGDDDTDEFSDCSAVLSGNIRDGHFKYGIADLDVKLTTPEAIYETTTDSNGDYEICVEDFQLFLEGNTFEVDDDNIECDNSQSLEECVGLYYKYKTPIALHPIDNVMDVAMIYFDPMEDSPHYEDNLTFINAVKNYAPEQYMEQNLLSMWGTSYPLAVSVSAQTNGAEGWNGFINEYGVDYEEAIHNAIDVWNQDEDYFVLETNPNASVDISINILPEQEYNSILIYGLPNDFSIFTESSTSLETIYEIQEDADVNAIYTFGKLLGHIGTHVGFNGDSRGEAEDYVMSIGELPNDIEYQFMALSAPDGLEDRDMDHYLWD